MRSTAPAELAPARGRDLVACPAPNALPADYKASRQVLASSTQFGKNATFFVIATPGYLAGLTGRAYR